MSVDHRHGLPSATCDSRSGTGQTGLQALSRPPSPAPVGTRSGMPCSATPHFFGASIGGYHRSPSLCSLPSGKAAVACQCPRPQQSVRAVLAQALERGQPSSRWRTDDESAVRRRRHWCAQCASLPHEPRFRSGTGHRLHFASTRNGVPGVATLRLTSQARALL